MLDPWITASGIDRVDADPVRAAFLGEAAPEVQGRRFRRGVRGGIRPCDERVLRADEDDRAATALLDQNAERLPCGQEVAAGEHRVAQLPVVERRLGDRRARREPCRRDQDVQATVLENRPADHLLRRRPRWSRRPRRRPLADAVRGDELRRDVPGAVAVQVRDDDVRAARGEQACGRAADAAGAARDHGDAAGELPRRRRLRELVALERPVLDRECLLLAEGAEPADRVGGVLDDDRAVVEVARGPGLRRRRARSSRCPPRESARRAGPTGSIGNCRVSSSTCSA